MEKIACIALLNDLEDRVKKSQEIMKVNFQSLQGLELLKPSSTGGWSIVQCIEHLNTYGNFYLPEIDLALKNAGNKPATDYFSSGWLGNYLTKIMDPKSPKKYKAFKNHIPAQELNCSMVMTQFMTQLNTLLNLIDRSKKVNLNSVKLPISLSRLIRLKLGDVFQFLIIHIERHLLQAMKNLNKGRQEHNHVR